MSTVTSRSTTNSWASSRSPGFAPWRPAAFIPATTSRELPTRVGVVVFVRRTRARPLEEYGNGPPGWGVGMRFPEIPRAQELVHEWPHRSRRVLGHEVRAPGQQSQGGTGQGLLEPLGQAHRKKRVVLSPYDQCGDVEFGEVFALRIQAPAFDPPSRSEERGRVLTPGIEVPGQASGAHPFFVTHADVGDEPYEVLDEACRLLVRGDGLKPAHPFDGPRVEPGRIEENQRADDRSLLVE